jgi:hypothetical protein
MSDPTPMPEPEPPTPQPMPGEPEPEPGPEDPQAKPFARARRRDGVRPSNSTRPLAALVAAVWFGHPYSLQIQSHVSRLKPGEGVDLS